MSCLILYYKNMNIEFFLFTVYHFLEDTKKVICISKIVFGDGGGGPVCWFLLSNCFVYIRLPAPSPHE